MGSEMCIRDRPSQGPTLKSAMRSLQMRLTRRVSRLIISHVTPASTSPMRPARLTLLMFSPFMPVPFLSSKSPGVPSNPYGNAGMLNVDRDDARDNCKRKKLEQSSVQQRQNARLRLASLLNCVRRTESAYGDPNAKPNGLAFLRLYFPNATCTSVRAILLFRDTRPASLRPDAKMRKPRVSTVADRTRQSKM